ncbi:MAG: PilT/PilU family type 4a pilus ATPase [Gammaproteobacteria bacterium]|nr:PilT/PilU family type 4a pilus ATPase [Gammaproteobacteria bacterium]MBU1654332.1 PilT/PilU family type 4a pilus ATPase [Gammaproteobacteria bacterium]MBU1961355.1 PilT/PilU family type 4a pilus ATPase [Gammaproteobacteria bacterium]
MSIDLPRVLQVMVKKNAADVFFHTGARISMKTPDGFIQLGEPLPPGITEKVVRENLPDDKIKRFDEQGEVDFSLSYKGIGRFRGNAFRQRGETSLVLRRVNSRVPSLEELGMPQALKDLVMQRNGLILVVGATGSGKTTTLAAMIDHRNSSVGGHILTLEDPIEFMHNHKKSIVAQREIGTDTQSFQTGMRSALREAPDVILLGEIRDLETMEFALKFANTGHLALTTLHANNTITTLERMLAFFEKDSQEAQAKRIAQNLRAIVCQRLAPREGGGKVAVVEVLINTPYIADLITKMELGQLKEAIEKGSNYGMQSFDQHLVDLYNQGVISEESAAEFADSKSNVKIKIRTDQAGKRIAQAEARPGGEPGGLSLTPKDSGEDFL